MNLLEKNRVRFNLFALEDRRLMTAAAALPIIDLVKVAPPAMVATTQAQTPIQVLYTPPAPVAASLPSALQAPQAAVAALQLNNQAALASPVQAAATTLDLKPKYGQRIVDFIKSVTPGFLRKDVKCNTFTVDSNGKLQLDVSVTYGKWFLKTTVKIGVTINVKTQSGLKVTVKVGFLPGLTIPIPFVSGKVSRWILGKCPEIATLIK